MIGFQNMRNRKVVFVRFIRDSFIHQGGQNKNKMKVNHCIFRQTHFKVNYCSLRNCRVSFAIFHGNSFFQLSDQFRFFLSKLQLFDTKIPKIKSLKMKSIRNLLESHEGMYFNDHYYVPLKGSIKKLITYSILFFEKHRSFQATI